MKIRPLPLAIAGMVALAAVKMTLLADAFGWSAAPEAHASSAPPQKLDAKPAPPATSIASCPPSTSDGERKILESLRGRRQQLDERAKQLGMQENILNAAEKKLASRVKELSDLQNRLEAIEAKRKKREEANWQGLVRTYEAMQPRDAAAIMNGMDMQVLLEVLDRMNDRKAAMVLAAMQPDRAREATTKLAEKRLKEYQAPK